MDNKITSTEVHDWFGNVLTTFQGEKTAEAEEWIRKTIYQNMIKNGIIDSDTSMSDIFESEELEELFISVREVCYIATKNANGDEFWFW